VRSIHNVKQFQPWNCLLDHYFSPGFGRGPGEVVMLSSLERSNLVRINKFLLLVGGLACSGSALPFHGGSSPTLLVKML
jgi:hypothetical protein